VACRGCAESRHGPKNAGWKTTAVAALNEVKGPRRNGEFFSYAQGGKRKAAPSTRLCIRSAGFRMKNAAVSTGICGLPH